MLRLLVKLALAAAAVAAVWSWVPVGERTMADRWRAASTPGLFLDRIVTELRGREAGERPIPRATPGRPGRPRPAEAHSDADRRALERILSDRLDEPPARP
jgi:hypothetical protein